MLITELKSFYAVARAGNVTRAAQQLGVSQPTVTGQLKSLEARYGLELFYRRGRALQLSEDGRRLLPMAEQLVQKELEIAFHLRDASALSHGSMRLGLTGPYYLMPIIARYREQFPGISLSLSVANSSSVLQALRDYQLELASSSVYAEGPELHRITLARDRLRLAVRRDHRLARHDSVRLADIEPETLLQREPGSMTRKVSERLLERAGVQPAEILEIANREAIIQAVVHGLGCCLIPAREAPPHPELVCLDIVDADIQTEEYVYCLKERMQVQSIARFLALITPLSEP